DQGDERSLAARSPPVGDRLLVAGPEGHTPHTTLYDRGIAADGPTGGQAVSGFHNRPQLAARRDLRAGRIPGRRIGDRSGGQHRTHAAPAIPAPLACRPRPDSRLPWPALQLV